MRGEGEWACTKRRCGSTGGRGGGLLRTRGLGDGGACGTLPTMGESMGPSMPSAPFNPPSRGDSVSFKSTDSVGAEDTVNGAGNGMS